MRATGPGLRVKGLRSGPGLWHLAVAPAQQSSTGGREAHRARANTHLSASIAYDASMMEPMRETPIQEVKMVITCAPVELGQMSPKPMVVAEIIV